MFDDSLLFKQSAIASTFVYKCLFSKEHGDISGIGTEHDKWDWSACQKINDLADGLEREDRSSLMKQAEV